MTAAKIAEKFGHKAALSEIVETNAAKIHAEIEKKKSDLGMHDEANDDEEVESVPMVHEIVSPNSNQLDNCFHGKDQCKKELRHIQDA